MPNVPASCGRVVNCGLGVTAASLGPVWSRTQHSRAGDGAAVLTSMLG